MSWTRRPCSASSRRCTAGPAKVVIVGCEPADVENLALELTPPVKAAVERAAGVVLEELNTCCSPTRPTTRADHARALACDRDRGRRGGEARRGSPGDLRPDEDRRAAPGRPRVPGLLLRHLLPRHGLPRSRPGAGAAPGAPSIAIPARSAGASICPTSGVLRAPGATSRCVSGTEFEVDSIEVNEKEGGRMHRTKVKVAEDALDANTTIASANRHDFDHAGVRVVNLMSAPGAGKRPPCWRPRCPGLIPASAVLEGDVQGSMDADRIAHLHLPVVSAQHGGRLRRRMPPRRPTWFARHSGTSTWMSSTSW